MVTYLKFFGTDRQTYLMMTALFTLGLSFEFSSRGKFIRVKARSRSRIKKAEDSAKDIGLRIERV